MLKILARFMVFNLSTLLLQKYNSLRGLDPPAVPLYRWLLNSGIRRKKSEYRPFVLDLVPRWLDATISKAAQQATD